MNDLEQNILVQRDRIIKQYKLSESFDKLNDIAINSIVKEVLAQEERTKSFLEKIGAGMAPRFLTWKSKASNAYSEDLVIKYSLCANGYDTNDGLMARIDVVMHYNNTDQDYEMHYKLSVRKTPPGINDAKGYQVKSIIKKITQEDWGKFDDKEVTFSLFQDAYCELAKMGYVLPAEIVVEPMVVRK